MSFGQGYTPQESAPQLPEGEYKTRISGVTCTADEYGRQTVRVALDFQDNAGRRVVGYKPDSIYFSDRPMYEQDLTDGQRAKGMGLTDIQRRWDMRMTEFFDAYAIPRGEMNIDAWKAHTGYVRVQRQVRAGRPTGYMDVTPLVRQQAAQAQTGSAPAAAQQAPKVPQTGAQQIQAQAEAWRAGQMQASQAPVQDMYGMPDDGTIPF